MGREARCTVRHGRRVSEGKALLETDELVFRGEFRLRIPFAAMTSVEAVDGRLEVTSADGTAIFELGQPEAQRWAQRILHPPSLMDKLGVTAGARVVVVGVDDEPFWAYLRQRTDEISEGVSEISEGLSDDVSEGISEDVVGSAPADVVVLGVDEAADLAALPAVKQWIAPAGAVWVVWRKARKELTEHHIRESALEAGLVDVKVARFSGTHSALKLVIPVKNR